MGLCTLAPIWYSCRRLQDLPVVRLQGLPLSTHVVSFFSHQNKPFAYLKPSGFVFPLPPLSCAYRFKLGLRLQPHLGMSRAFL